MAFEPIAIDNQGEAAVAQAQQGLAAEDPPGRFTLVSFVCAYGEPFARLQSDFHCVSTRIGQASNAQLVYS